MPSGALELVHTLECDHGAVLSLCARGDWIYAGCQEGYVKVWDTQTKTLVRTIIVQEVCCFSAYLVSRSQPLNMSDVSRMWISFRSLCYIPTCIPVPLTVKSRYDLLRSRMWRHTPHC